MGELKVEGIKIDIPKDLNRTFHSRTSICKVPSAIRDGHKEAYTPKVISIGPIHRDKPELQKMETQKAIYLQLFCQRVLPRIPQAVVDDISRTIKACQEQIRGCYEWHWESMSNAEFVKMILLDAVFILEFLIRWDERSKHEDDFILGQPSIAEATLLDLHLLENQIPYFLLKRLYDETLKCKENDGFDQLVCRVLFDSNGKMDSSIFEGAKHFLDLLRNSFLNVGKKNPNLIRDNKSKHKLKFTASKLQQAGVKFEAVKRVDNWKFHVEFKTGLFRYGALRIPVLEVRDYSELEFRNLMAFEQHHYPREAYICDFFFLMDYLINTAEDVELLVDAGIIIHWYGSNKIFADLINKLCHGMSDYATCYAPLYEKLNKHYDSRVNHWMATLKLVYFSNLWRGTGTLAAIVLLVMTLLQTIGSVKQY